MFESLVCEIYVCCVCLLHVHECGEVAATWVPRTDGHAGKPVGCACVHDGVFGFVFVVHSIHGTCHEFIL